VQQVATSSGATTTTSYLGALEEVTSSGGTATTTAYYGGLAESVNGTLSYLLADGLGSATASVSISGSVTATQLYGPYGAVRYQSDTLPTDHGYTGQISDAATSGLDYYGARYYDAVAGQFTSADTWLAGGLNRYAYVGDSPEVYVDPSGHEFREGENGDGGGIDGGETDGTVGGGGDGSPSDGNDIGSVTDPVTSTVSLGNGETEVTYVAYNDSFIENAAGTDVGEVDENGNIVTTKDDELQAAANAQDRLSQSDETETASNASTRPPSAGDAPNGSLVSTQHLGGNDGTTGSSPDESSGFGKLTGVQIQVTPEGLSMVETHLGNEFFDQVPENNAMIGRLRMSMENNEPVTGADASFYMHEVTEYNLMKDSPYTIESYQAAHEAALAQYGVSRFSVYHPDVISTYPENFGSAWKAFWGI
jgi:RHS repeat-associated protein